ncbi:hypothetical protein [Galbitalea soli]|uniref:Uncharacterized protein n=2 Tax=Galbitalea soli TaxID=1268042 RepID=A0A7C9TND6_9MICO|nr:hypothetical protein [Galbitalea soli]NEM89739.1 hypothetical protein [Galbitalea soli]
MQKLVYELVRERAAAMFGPGSSFAVTLRRSDENETMFTETVVETLAWDVSLGLEGAMTASAATAAATSTGSIKLPTRLTA